VKSSLRVLAILLSEVGTADGGIVDEEACEADLLVREILVEIAALRLVTTDYKDLQPR